MATDRRYFFALRDADGASGGRRYAYMLADFLNEIGCRASVLHESAGFRLEWFQSDTPTTHLAGTGRGGLRRTVRGLRHRLRNQRAGATNPSAPVTLGPDDVVFLPETMLARAPRFSPAHIVVLNQNGFYFGDTIGRVGQRGGRVRGVVSTSRHSDAWADALGFSDRAVVPYVIDPDLFAFQPDKAPQIAYMPRKRARDAQALVTLLNRRDQIGDFDLIPIDGMSQEEAADTLRRSLVFVSLSEREGFGLPPAEALATGALVVGHTGIGGREFLDASTARVVEDGDTLGVVHQVEATVAAYTSSANGLMDERRAISRRILGTYSRDAALAACRTALGAIEAWIDAASVRPPDA